MGVHGLLKSNRDGTRAKPERSRAIDCKNGTTEHKAPKEAISEKHPTLYIKMKPATRAKGDINATDHAGVTHSMVALIRIVKKL